MCTDRRARAWAGCQRALLLSLLGSVLLSGCLPITETEFANLRVRVVDESGAPVVGASVTPVGGWFWSSPRGIDHTDEDGWTEFSLPPTAYMVYAFPPHGYGHINTETLATEVTVHLQEGDRVEETLVFHRF